jgi:AraC-like DNA-binding protein
VAYERAYNEALRLVLREDGDHAVIEVGLEFGEPGPRDQALDLVMAALLGTVRALVGPEWMPRAAHFARPSPPDAAPWHRLFGARVVFAGGSTALVLRPRDLDAPVIASDPSLRPYTQQFLRSVVAPRAAASTTAVADVADALEVLLPLGRQSMARTARILGLRPDGLQRYLAEQGETFSAVLDATRAGLAERHLANSRHTLTEVSRLLGFSAPSAFSRWFRHRFGTSPSEWRRTAHDGSGGGVFPTRPAGRAGPTVRSG